MKFNRWLAAILLVVLLLASMMDAATTKSMDRGKDGSERSGDTELREKAKAELDLAESLLKNALYNVSILESRSSKKIRALIGDAEKALDKARELLEHDPARSLALSKHVQALIKIITKTLGSVEGREHEGAPANLTEVLVEPREAAPEIPGEPRPITVSNVSVWAEEARIGRNESMGEVSGNYTAEMEATRLPGNISTGVAVSTVVADVSVPAEGPKNETVIIKAFRVENKSIHEETVVISENQTIVAVRRTDEAGNKSLEVQVVLEKNQSIVGAFIEVASSKNFSVRFVDKLMEVELVELAENRLRLRVSAPNGTSGRLIIVKLDPQLFKIDDLDEVRVFVNGSEAILASSLIDLISDVYREPAYVFVMSSEGISVLIYIPHFSSYTLDIVGVIRAAISSLENFLSKTLTHDTLVASTILATVVLMALALLHVRRKSTLYRI